MKQLILVVDDDRDIRDSLVELLDDHGYQALGAGNGLEALEILRTTPVLPCLILLDLMMPMMDGRDFRAHQVQNPVWASIPVIVISAYNDVEDQARTLQVDYLRKPLTVRPLMAAVGRYCTD